MTPSTALRVFALLSAMAFSAHAAPNPRLAALQIEIWPEYDRPGVLVILKAELAADAALPAQVQLRIPASSGGPSAVAYAEASDKIASVAENLVNLPYEQDPAGSSIALRMRPPGRFFHVEFYDRLDAVKAERAYGYTWPGDFAVERLSVLVKEPAASSNLAVQPALDMRPQGSDGFAHRAGALGAFKAGQPLAIELRYTKSDPRPSTEIVGVAQPAAGPVQLPPEPSKWPLVLIAAGIGGVLLALGAFLWRRGEISASRRFCSQCGKAVGATDRFCAGCGKAQT